MPLHEYQCKKCKHRFEKIQKFSDRPIKKCPECGGPLEQLLHAPAVQFKGSGWYVTDYGKGEGSKPESSSEKKDTAKEKDDGPKGGKEKDKESKPDSKSKKTEKSESKKSKD